LKNEFNSEISIVGEFRKREESMHVVKATRPSPVATTTTEVAASNSCFVTNRPPVNMRSSSPVEKDKKDSMEYPLESFSPPPLTIATPRRDDLTKHRHPLEKMKQRAAFFNGNDSDKMTKRDVDEKVSSPIERDERRVAPLIIRAPKMMSADKDVGGIHVEKIEVIRLPAKLNNKVRASTTTPPPPKNVDSNDSSSNDDLQRQKSPSKSSQIVEKSKTSKSVDGSVESNANKMTKKRKREFKFKFKFYVCV
jgi:hypothetical protein